VRTDLPLLRNVHIGQILYGAAVAYLALEIYRDLAPGGPIPRSTFFMAVGLVVATLLFAVYLNNMYRFGVTPDYAEVCEWCGGPVNTYSEFCEHCGADLVYDEVVECPSCGVEAYAGTPHCPECGASLPEPEEPPGEGGEGGGDGTHYHA
jgi:hypothetical protein